MEQKNNLIKVLVVEPEKTPYVKEIEPTLSSYQAEVGGYIQAIYPFDDPVAIICNEEGKLNGLDLNRALRDEDGVIYDIVAGTFLVVGLSEDDFASLDDGLIKQFSEKYKTPEMFVAFNGKIMVLPMTESCKDVTRQEANNERMQKKLYITRQTIRTSGTNGQER